MATARVVPHRLARSAVSFSPWLVEDGSSLVSLAAIPAWDYARPLTFHSRVHVDRDMALELTGLAGAAQFAVAVTAECRDTYWRQVDLTPVDDSANVVTRVPEGLVAKRVSLERRVVVLQEGPGADGLAPRRGNSVAGHDDRTVVTLEGAGGQFPTEAMSFRETGRPDAPWQLNLTYEEVTDSFLGSVQLLLNLDDVRARALASGDGSEDTAEILRILPWDLGRQLISRAIADERLVAGGDWPEGSVGEALERLCVVAGLGSIAEARNKWLNDPDRFDARVKAGFGGLR